MSDNIEIHIYGAHSLLKGDYPKDVAKGITSYQVQGFQFSKAFRKGVWDGRKHLLNTRTGAFPTGLVRMVKEAIEGTGLVVDVVDHRNPPTPTKAGFDLIGVKFDYPYDYQLDACKKMVEAKQGIVKMATNAGKTAVSAAVTQYLGLPTLFVVSSVELLYQGQKRFLEYLGLTEKEIGIIGDGIWQPGTFVTIAMLPTLEARISTSECIDFLKSIEVLFFDEMHHLGSDGWFTVSTLCNAYWRFGLSGTPCRTDGADLRLVAAVGEQIVDVSNKLLVERGVSAQATIFWDKITEPVLKKKLPYPTVYKQGVVENAQLLNKVVDWVRVFRDAGLSTLVLCEDISHGILIDDALWTDIVPMVPHQFIHGEEDTDTRRTALENFANRKLPVLISSRILDEGVDVPTIDALILAGSRKSKIRTLQRLGRGLRGKKLIVVEFANFCHRYLLKHSLERMSQYKEENCFSIRESGPNLSLIQNLK
jgi:superfamily II DNA or RNA helicase